MNLFNIWAENLNVLFNELIKESIHLSISLSHIFFYAFFAIHKKKASISTILCSQATMDSRQAKVIAEVDQQYNVSWYLQLSSHFHHEPACMHSLAKQKIEALAKQKAEDVSARLREEVDRQYAVSWYFQLSFSFHREFLMYIGAGRTKDNCRGDHAALRRGQFSLFLAHLYEL